MLTGPDAQATEQLHYEQGPAQQELYQDALQAAEPPQLLQVDNREYDWAGRGGTTVWRAYRRGDLQDFEEWLVTRQDDGDAPQRQPTR